MQHQASVVRGRAAIDGESDTCYDGPGNRAETQQPFAHLREPPRRRIPTST
jgi:hypothetical protein